MHSLRLVSVIAILLAIGVGQAQSQTSGGGKIVCWKDKSGKIVGCGDKVPPEYQDSATNELNKRGVTVKQSDAALTPEQKKAQQAELERKHAEDLKKQEQRRKDKALVDTFSNEKEIDLKRGRDVQLIESHIETLQTNLKNANDRQADSRARIEQYNKNKKPVPPVIQEEYDRVEGEKAKIQNQIAQKRKEIADKNTDYDEMKKRFNELRGGTASSGQTATGTTPAPAPAASAAPGKK